MINESETFYAQWLQKAAEDEFAAEEILGGKRFPAPACFHFQQMAEKYLKGLIVFRKRKFAKVHDLLELETTLAETDPDVQNLHADLEVLNHYYLETRYPGDYPEITLAECQAARAAALRVKEFVTEKIKT